MLRAFIEERFQRWLDRRIPSHTDIELTQKRLFIFPSKQGIAFFGVIFLSLVAAINYQNNLAYILVFFLVSIFNTAILITYQNLQGLRLSSGRSKPVYEGDYAEVIVDAIRSGKKPHHQFYLGWPSEFKHVFDLVIHDKVRIKLHCLAQQRGIYKPGRLLVESYYPLGLLRCWSWVDLDIQLLVYPKPLYTKIPVTVTSQGEFGFDTAEKGNDDFYGLRDYQPGDPLKHADWKSFAKGQALQSKIYASKQSEEQWVDWDAIQGGSTEERLSKLCYWVLELEKRGVAYGLKLPGTEINVSEGELHKHQCLKALALYEGGAR